jgi:4-hydroxybenzoate polyprenyltransferase
VEFDRGAGLHSWAVKRGIGAVLAWALALHMAMLGVLALFGWLAALGAGFWIAMAAVAGALLYEHRAAARRDVGGVNRAFFEANAAVGIAFVLGIFWDQVVAH